jgi:transglutaminase superfamily protein
VSISIALPKPATLTRTQRAAARVSVTAAYLLLAATRRRPGILHHLLTVADRHTRRPASLAEATAAHRAVTAVSLHCASDYGCRRRSLAVVVWCVATRRAATWVTGAATGPVASHAWVQTSNGRPVAEPVNPHLLYQSIIVIPGRETT